MSWMALLAAGAVLQGEGADARIVDYLEEHVRPGQRVVVSELYNEVFTAPEERRALDRMFNTFFKIPLFAAQFQQAEGRPPSLEELSQQFGFRVPGQAAVLLKIMESDPRMPPFLERDPGSGEITRVDVEAITDHPRFGKLLERSLAGWVGRSAPELSLVGYDGEPIGSAQLEGRPHLLYFWFTACPPCVKTTPLLVELYEEYAPEGFEIVAVNADRVLELPYSDGQREEYAGGLGIRFRLAHLTPEALEAFGSVSVFPTMFFVDAGGVVVEHKVNFQERDVLEAAIRRTFE